MSSNLLYSEDLISTKIVSRLALKYAGLIKTNFLICYCDAPLQKPKAATNVLLIYASRAGPHKVTSIPRLIRKMDLEPVIILIGEALLN